MADYDLFDLTGVQFDPPDKQAKKVYEKIEQKIKDLGAALGRESQITGKREIQEQLDLLNGILASILKPDKSWKDEAEFKRLAAEKVKKEMQALKGTLAVLRSLGERSVTMAVLKERRNEIRLSMDHMKQVYKEAGFEIIEIKTDDNYPKFPTNSDRTAKELETLQKTRDPNPDGADTSVAVDLYAFAAYLSNDTKSTELYRAMDTKALWAIFDAASKKFSLRNDDLGKLCGSIATAAKTNVFDSDQHREAYRQYLVYQSAELKQLFATLKTLTKPRKEKADFAERCIRLIAKYFPDYQVALAIYNREGNCEYLPVDVPTFLVRCHSCDVLNEFKSEEDAIKANKCQNCGRALYKKCPKCSKPVLENKDSCPSCGYVFASAALFTRYYQNAQAALRRNDFDTARQELFQAESAAPGEKTRIDTLRKEIDRTEKELKEPIKRLDKLINDGLFCTAKTELGKITREHPGLNVTDFRRRIEAEVSQADRMFASAASYSPSQKADVCVEILHGCKDHPQADMFLRATAPRPCVSITVTTNSGEGIISVSWSHSAEQGVKYCLLRKRGGTGSISETDGEILANECQQTSYSDKSAKPGCSYTYTVFTVRHKVYSSPVSKTGMLYADVKNLRLTQRGESVRITWDAPENSRGAIIIRENDGSRVTLTQSAYGSYEDTGSRYGKTYTYKVYANYEGNGRSVGADKVITVLPLVESFTFQAAQVRDNLYRITWTIRQQGVNIRVMVNNSLAGEAKSEDISTQIALPRDTYCTIRVLAFSGGKWLDSDNTVDVNMYSACGIDKKATVLEETTSLERTGTKYRINLKICLSGKISPMVAGFYYAVRPSSHARRWATRDDIGRDEDLQKISLAAYQRQGFIPWQGTVVSESSFFITVFTCYIVNGKEIVSEPQKLKVVRPLNANLFWGVSYGYFDGLRLSIELRGNRPIDHVPELYLCVCDQRQFLRTKDDMNSQVLMRIPAVELDSPAMVYQQTYKLEKDLPGRFLKSCKYFLFSGEEDSKDAITFRWQAGFSGKL